MLCTTPPLAQMSCCSLTGHCSVVLGSNRLQKFHSTLQLRASVCQAQQLLPLDMRQVGSSLLSGLHCLLFWFWYTGVCMRWRAKLSALWLHRVHQQRPVTCAQLGVGSALPTLMQMPACVSAMRLRQLSQACNYWENECNST